jgi:HEAT repeat protein
MNESENNQYPGEGVGFISLIQKQASSMLRVSEQTRTLLEQLYRLQTDRSWFGGTSRTAQTIALLDRIAEQRESVCVPVIARCLFSPSTEVRIAACRAIHHILAPLPPDDLLLLSGVIGWSWGWYVSDAWDNLKPTDIASLVADALCRSTILGFASFHRNGYVRHEAVRLLSGIHGGSELPFLLIRQNDWVEPISADAREAVRSRLKDDNLPAFLRCLPLVVHLLKFRRHDHSQVVHQVVEMLLPPDKDDSLKEVLRSSNRDVRREVLRIALDLDGEHQPRIVGHGLDSTDAVVRYWCASRVRHCWSLEKMPEMIQRLQQDRYMPVRREGMSLEAEVHPERSQEVWQRALLDWNASIRDLARFHLQKMPGFNGAEFYRHWLATKGPSLPAISGLGETGDSSDLALLRGFLTSHLSGWRRAAIRGLAALGKEAVAPELAGCLHDESPGVVREAGRKLVPLVNSVPGEMLLKVVLEGDSEQAKQTALRLIFEKGKWDSLPWLIRAADHRDASVAKKAQSFIEAWFTPPLCNRVFSRPSPSEQQAIDEAVSAKKASWPKPFLDKLEGWLNDRWT